MRSWGIRVLFFFRLSGTGRSRRAIIRPQPVQSGSFVPSATAVITSGYAQNASYDQIDLIYSDTRVSAFFDWSASAVTTLLQLANEHFLHGYIYLMAYDVSTMHRLRPSTLDVAAIGRSPSIAVDAWPSQCQERAKTAWDGLQKTRNKGRLADLDSRFHPSYCIVPHLQQRTLVCKCVIPSIADETPPSPTSSNPQSTIPSQLVQTGSSQLSPSLRQWMALSEHVRGKAWKSE